MIYVTGDTHGDFGGRFNVKNFPEQKELTKEDYVIICGDFGGIWDVGEEGKGEKYWLDWFAERPYTLLFVDGNHENFDRLYTYPEKEWHGGFVHEIRPSVLHLMRGQVFEICGKKIFTFGGASSHDISGGILEKDDPYFKRKKRRLERDWLPYRINHISWWKEELPSQEEMDEGMKNLEKHNYTVDYIITHCAATDTQDLIKPQNGTDIMTDYLQKIKNIVQYEKWFFGHYHTDRMINEKERVLSTIIERIC